ncbi:MAG: hypothetical protein HZA59_07280 [Hydrogenophilales bacterium]|nr:hypothetical protein [Hydrogenophilales bacterium]
MKLQQKLLATLLAVAFTGGAHAAMQNSTSGNGSLYASVSNGTTSSAVFDLGFLLDDFLPASLAAASTKTWNLATSSPAAGVIGVTNYSTIWSQFAATVTNWGAVVFDVAAGDNTGSGLGTDRYLSTSTDPFATVAAQKNANLANFGLATDLYLTSNNALGTHGTTDNGASLSTGGTSLYATGKGDKWVSKSTWDTTGIVGTASDFYYVQTSSANGLSNATTPTAYAGKFNLTQAGVLTYSVAAVPEADTWAMFAAGLLAVGAIARRRMQA